MKSFFDTSYVTPAWLKRKSAHEASRRRLLKSALGATAALALTPVIAATNSAKQELATLKKTDPWLTLDVVTMHLLPASDLGPSAQEINALAYFHNVIYQQPTDEEEVTFIFNGVGWLNGYCQTELKKNFVELTTDEKERMLRAISRSTAGRNWINTLIGYIFEAMLAPPAYGGNTNGIGWKWLEHQAGFPLPKAGDRYYELPSYDNINISWMKRPKRTMTASIQQHKAQKKAV